MTRPYELEMHRRTHVTYLSVGEQTDGDRTSVTYLQERFGNQSRQLFIVFPLGIVQV